MQEFLLPDPLCVNDLMKVSSMAQVYYHPISCSGRCLICSLEGRRDDGHLRGESGLRGSQTKEMCGVTPNRRQNRPNIQQVELELSLSLNPFVPL